MGWAISVWSLSDQPVYGLHAVVGYETYEVDATR